MGATIKFCWSQLTFNMKIVLVQERWQNSYHISFFQNLLWTCSPSPIYRSFPLALQKFSISCSTENTSISLVVSSWNLLGRLAAQSPWHLAGNQKSAGDTNGTAKSMATSSYKLKHVLFNKTFTCHLKQVGNLQKIFHLIRDSLTEAIIYCYWMHQIPLLPGLQCAKRAQCVADLWPLNPIDWRFLLSNAHYLCHLTLTYYTKLPPTCHKFLESCWLVQVIINDIHLETLNLWDTEHSLNRLWEISRQITSLLSNGQIWTLMSSAACTTSHCPLKWQTVFHMQWWSLGSLH
jgi:hypothetical protein